MAPRRSALVIGNSAYAEARLANASNDANAVARALQDIGFKVMLILDADKRTIIEQVTSFSRSLGSGEIGLFYFSGHGIQMEGETYLVPVNAQLSYPDDAQYDAVPLGRVLTRLESSNAVARIIILDACRNNPFYKRWPASIRSSPMRGLAAPLSTGRGTFIAFSTAPGEVAADALGDGQNSPFTTHLLRHLRTPNLEVGQLFRRIRGDVLRATRNKQTPWVSEALEGEIYLNPRGEKAAIFSQAPAASPALAQFQPRSAVESSGSAVQSETPNSAPARSLTYALRGHTGAVESVAFSPDGRRIVSGSSADLSLFFTKDFKPDKQDNTLRLWDAATGKPIGPPLQGHTSFVFSVAFSPDGRRIVSGSADNTLRLWDAATGKPIGPPLQGHTAWVRSVAFSPDGRRIVSGSDDKTLRLWDAATGQPLGFPP
ncbi:MAG: caspase family protein [Cyanobacteriota bacterium]